VALPGRRLPRLRHRVQIIKRDPATRGGVLQFGTELVVGGDGSIAGVLLAQVQAETTQVLELNG
jgi:L-2-hydroxyglutarate oxidase LhgO